MNDLQVFNNETFGSVRVFDKDGEPWFVGKDVAEILGYTDTSQAIKAHVDDDDKLTRQFDVSGQSRNMITINESGVYSLVFQSKMPKAKEFKRWVTAEVLPSIRKHGGYLTPAKIEEVLSNPDTVIQLATQLKEERAKRQAAESALEEAKPAQIFAAAVTASPKAILIRGLANFLKQNGIDIGQNRLFTWMRDNGFLIKSGSERNMPTQRSMEMGLFQVKESAFLGPHGENVLTRTVKVTGKGQIYFVNRFFRDRKGT